MAEVHETIRFTAVNVMDRAEEKLEVFPEQRISEIRPQIDEALELSDWVFGDGDETTWWLHNPRYAPDEYLSDTDLVRDVIREGDTLEASPTFMAGGR